METLGDALDTFRCEDAVDLIDGDWNPLRRGKISAFLRLTLHIVAHR